MSPLFTYNGVLLVKNNALATDINCCCVEVDCPCVGFQSIVTVNFGKDSTGGLAYPYGSTNITFISFTNTPQGCQLVWGAGGLSLTIIIGTDGIISNITLVDNRVGGHNRTWTYTFDPLKDHRPCLVCDKGILKGTFDRWTVNGFSNRGFNNWHEAEYTRYFNDTYLPMRDFRPTLENGGIINIGNFLKCISYRFKIKGYHKFTNDPRNSDAEYQQAFPGQNPIWTIEGGGIGAPGLVTPTPIAGPSPAPNGQSTRVVTSWGAFDVNHLYRSHDVLLDNDTILYGFINDSRWDDNAEIDPYYLSGWQKFPNISL